MNAPWGGSPPHGPVGGDTGSEAAADAALVVDVLHRVGRCSLRSLLTQPELVDWTSGRLEQAVTHAWSGGLVFIDRNDDLVAL